MTERSFNQWLREHPLWVTGMGSYCAAGRNVPELWTAALAARSPARLLSLPEEVMPQPIPACVVPDIHLKEGLKRSFHRMDRVVQLAAIAAAEAWTQAGLDQSIPAPHRTGVIVGSSRGPIGQWARSMQELGRRPVLPSAPANSTLACLSGSLAAHLGVYGPSLTVSTACASGAHAIALGAQQIVLGEADVMLVGGAETPLEPLVVTQLHATGVLAAHPEAAQACRPFDAHRNGLTLGEGAAFLVLESSRTAAARGATPLAILAGWAMASDAGGRVGVTPGGEGLHRVLQDSLAMAGTAPNQVDYFNAHGTGTKANDRAEAAALARLLGSSLPVVPVSSTKPVTGHCVGASPAIEAVIAIQALNTGLLPPNANCPDPDPECPLNLVLDEPREARVRTVVSHSLGFWSNYAALVFQKL